MNQQLNEKESLDLITAMILNTKQNFSRNSGNQLIVWGLSTIFTSTLVTVVLYLTNNLNANWLWFIHPILATIICSRLKRQESVKTRMDKMITRLFNVTLVVCCAIPFIITAFWFWTDIPKNPGGYIWIMIPMLEMFVVSVSLVISGAIMGFNALSIGGGFGILLSFAILIPIELGVLYACFCLWGLVSMVIPGIKLNRYAKKQIDA